MFCPRCGTENEENAKFCKKCGENFKKPKKNILKNKWHNLVLIGLILVVSYLIYAFCFTSHVAAAATYPGVYGDVTFNCPENIGLSPSSIGDPTLFFNWNDERAKLTGDDTAATLTQHNPQTYNKNAYNIELPYNYNSTVSGYPAGFYFDGTDYFLRVNVAANETWILKSNNLNLFNTIRNSIKIS